MIGNIEQRYVRQDDLTDPGDLGGAYDDLPATVAGLREVVSGVIVHVSWAERYGIPPDMPMVRHTQPIAKRLQLIQAAYPGSLRAERPPQRRTFGTCRDYALLLCSMLRHRSIPARVRCGFATYFDSPYHDHWICEYRSPDEARWVQVDAQLDPFHIEQLRITFDAADLPRGALLTASQAWRLARAGTVAPELFGHADASGLWFLRVDVWRDVLSLVNRQMSAWDTWRDATPASKILDSSTLAELDALADAVTVFEGGADQYALLNEAASRNMTPPWLK